MTLKSKLKTQWLQLLDDSSGFEHPLLNVDGLDIQSLYRTELVLPCSNAFPMLSGLHDGDGTNEMEGVT